jgi:hypothetical protein
MPNDGYRIVAFASLSQVQRIRRLLSESGCFVDMIRTPISVGLKGCGFALRCAAEMEKNVRNAAIDQNIEVRGIFAETTEGYRRLP